MHIKRPRNIQIPTVKFTPCLMCCISNFFNFLMIGKTFPAEFVFALFTPHMITPIHLLNPPSTTRTRTFLTHAIQHFLCFPLILLILLVVVSTSFHAKVILRARFVVMPGTFVMYALLIAAGYAVHVWCWSWCCEEIFVIFNVVIVIVVVIKVELTRWAIRVKTPSEFRQLRKSISREEFFIMRESFRGSVELKFGVGENRGTLRTCEIFGCSLRVELRGEPGVHAFCAGLAGVGAGGCSGF